MKIFSALPVFIYLLVYSALFLDSYKNPKSFESLVFFSPALLMLVALLFNLLIRIKKKGTLPSIFINFNKYLIFPVFSILTLILSVWTYLSPPNHVYSIIPVNLLPILFMAILGGLIGLINVQGSFIKNNYKQLIFLLPFFIIFFGILMSLWPFDFFIKLNEEDRFIENTQFVLLILGSLFSFVLGRKKGVIFYLIGLMLFIMAGEEISWGQRIFGTITPEYIASQNSQGEINIHNSGFFSQFTQIGYMLIGLYGAIGWIFSKRSLIIPWFLSVYFLPIFLYNLILPPSAPHSFGEWSEVTELLFYGGILGFILMHYFRLKYRQRLLF